MISALCAQNCSRQPRFPLRVHEVDAVPAADPQRARSARSCFANRRAPAGIFRDVLGLLDRAEGQEVDVEVVLEELALRLPYEAPQRMLRTLVNWGRHADLFDHDSERGKLFAEPPSKNQ